MKWFGYKGIPYVWFHEESEKIVSDPPMDDVWLRHGDVLDNEGFDTAESFMATPGDDSLWPDDWDVDLDGEPPIRVKIVEMGQMNGKIGNRNKKMTKCCEETVRHYAKTVGSFRYFRECVCCCRECRTSWSLNQFEDWWAEIEHTGVEGNTQTNAMQILEEYQRQHKEDWRWFECKLKKEREKYGKNTR